jgi:uncharacterized protein (TIGR02246 family)
MMSPRKPEDWPLAFQEHLNAGDLESVMDLYEPEARFVAASGETLVGRDRIRGPVGGLIRAQTRLESRVVRAVTVDDVALLYSDFRGTTVNESGERVPMVSQAIEVLRRQPDGTWKLIVGDPGGRGPSPVPPDPPPTRDLSMPTSAAGSSPGKTRPAAPRR